MIEQLSPGAYPVPLHEKDHIPIVMAASEEFLPYTCVAMHSVLAHGREECGYEFLLLSQNGYSPEGLALLETTIKDYPSCAIRLVTVGGYLPETLYTEGHVSGETYARLLIPRLLKHYNDVLYLDGDLVVLQDVFPLLSLPHDPEIYLSGVTDLDVLGQYCGPERSMRYYLEKKLHMHRAAEYLQAGVLVFHVQAMRAGLGEDALLKASTSGCFRYFDQDVLNVLCQGHIRLLDLRWNVVCDCDGYRVSHIIANTPEELQKGYVASRQDPWIVHYSGRQKPWADEKTDLGSYFQQAMAQVQLETQCLKEQKRPAESSRKRMLNRILPPQSRLRELCKILYFSYMYSSFKQL
ncbi:glycosyltransferase family 8 protein [Oscillibacter sp.]|uniref:glycosyltransferase family 8 protein n=1 Tax=Oscillibacter sp. TaxID=1945593 RepID=UPI002899BC05|nr:glycosyltransferase family 8 protein [Oscillibacter sp.]